MSRVYFHSKSNETEVLGMERAYANVMVSNIGLGLLELRNYYDSLVSLIPSDHYIQATLREDCFKPRKDYEVKLQTIGMIETAIRVDCGCGKPLFVLNGKSIDVWHLMLNTVMSIGSDTIKLLARLHAQCEMHAYIRGKNRNWLADIIECGREEGILREKVGWEDTIKMLRSNDKETIVLSYSVCESFPNPKIADWDAPIDPEYD